MGAFRPRFQRSSADRADRVTRMRHQELLFGASVLGAAIALNNCRHPRNMRLRPWSCHSERQQKTWPGMGSTPDMARIDMRVPGKPSVIVRQSGWGVVASSARIASARLHWAQETVVLVRGGGRRSWRRYTPCSPSFACDLLDFDFRNPSSLVDEKFEKPPRRP